MGVLDQVTQMRSQGLTEPEISMRLQEQGLSPREINDAFNQEKIKSAVSAEDSSMQTQESFYQPTTQEQPLGQEAVQNYQGQVPGLPGDPPAYQEPQQGQYQEQSPQQNYQEQYPQEQYPPQQYPQEEYYPQDQGQEPYAQDPYYDQGYDSQGGYQNQGSSTDTIIEISEQVFAEKIKKIEKQVEQFAEFAALAQTKITNNNERVKRMESIIDKLQIAILEKIGSYGKDLNSIKKEMEMIEDSFAKVVPELKKKGEHKSHSTTHKKTSHKK
jgi:hypothetical protein